MAEKSDDLPSLESLAAKIDRAKPEKSADVSATDATDMSTAFRYTAELMAGVVVGAMLGYGLDMWFGTLPWAMVVCLILGMVASIRNMLRADQQNEAKNMGKNSE